MWKYYSVALCANTQGQQNFMHVGCTAADELPIESIWGRIRTNLLPSLMGAPCCYQVGGRRWWDWCPPWREVRTSMRLASRRQRFNEIRSRMMKCGSLTYLLYPQNVASPADDCRLPDSWKLIKPTVSTRWWMVAVKAEWNTGWLPFVYIPCTIGILWVRWSFYGCYYNLCIIA